MGFRYRFVPFGTNFIAKSGTRSNSNDPSDLYENELALDVGGTCWGHQRESRPVIDHHFVRDNQFPSASAAVLHFTTRIRECLTPCIDHPDGVWLVTHRDPDFDAFCSMHLACEVLTNAALVDMTSLGIAPDSWTTMEAGRIDWFSPPAGRLATALRAPVLLAAYASVIDQCRRLHCRRNRALHSVLYAGLYRGRQYMSESAAASAFFKAASTAINDLGRHPLFDDVLGDNLEFKPEMDLLDNEEVSYEQDLRRCRRSVVSLPSAPGAAAEYLTTQRQTPLLDNELQVNSIHQLREAAYKQADAAWIRDPKCLLFKEWARQDVESSTLGEGFVFTAIAYSDGRRGANVNSTDYFFALNPERAAGRMLYSVWSALQTEEVPALLRSGVIGSEPRPNYGPRGGKHASIFDDPWFDGSNYDFTIVATPNRGTYIGAPGVSADLGDDPVARIVQREIEGGVYIWPAQVTDFAATRVKDLKLQRRVNALDARPPSNEAGCLRFVELGLRRGVDVARGGFADQTGRFLWSLLDANSGSGVPSDFTARHLLVDSHTVIVWSRRGIAIAYDERARDTVADLSRQVEDLASLSKEVLSFVEHASPTLGKGASEERRELDKNLTVGESLLRRVATLKQNLSLPEGRPLRRLFEALAFEQVVESLRDLVQRRKADRQNANDEENLATVAEVQLKVEWIEILIISFYTADLTHRLSESIGIFHEFIVPLTAGAGLLSGLLAAWSLQPWHAARDGHEGARRNSKWILLAPIVLAINYVVWLLVSIWKYFGEAH